MKIYPKAFKAKNTNNHLMDKQSTTHTQRTLYGKIRKFQRNEMQANKQINK